MDGCDKMSNNLICKLTDFSYLLKLFSKTEQYVQNKFVDQLFSQYSEICFQKKSELRQISNKKNVCSYKPRIPWTKLLFLQRVFEVCTLT